MESTARNNLEKTYKGLMEAVLPQEKRVMESFYERDKQSALNVLNEIVLVTMAAKCVLVSANDADFLSSAEELISLSMMHQEVKGVFKAIVKIDLDTPENDPLSNVSMLAVTAERLARVTLCLG